MSFTGNAGGRFQIRRIRNGSTAECFLTANGPFAQTFAEPTGFHTPNWNFVDSRTNTYADNTAYTVGTIVVFGSGDNEGLYRAREAIPANNTTGPTLNDTNELWEYEGPEGDPLILTPQLIVNGTDINLSGARAAAPVNAAITHVQWQVSTGANFVNIDPSLDGFDLLRPDATTVDNAVTTVDGVANVANGTNNYLLRIDRNLDNIANFNTGALMGGQLILRAIISYNITGVTDSAGANQVLMCTTGMTLTRTVLTESSMFSQIRLIDTTPSGQASNGSAAQIWNSGWTTDKTLRTDLYIGANNVAADATGLAGLTFQWHNSDGMIAGQTGRDLTINRNDVDTAETYFVDVTEVETGTVFRSNSLEIRDFLDPIQFVEVGTSTVDTASQGMLTVIPYQNGAPMAGLDGTVVINGETIPKTLFQFEIRRQNMPTDMTGQRIPWDTTFDIADRFPDNPVSRTYADDDDPVLVNGRANAGYAVTPMGATIVITDGEVGNFGCFIDYDVIFTMVGN